MASCTPHDVGVEACNRLDRALEVVVASPIRALVNVERGDAKRSGTIGAAILWQLELEVGSWKEAALWARGHTRATTATIRSAEGICAWRPGELR